jgi:fatty acid desaturase
MEQVEHPRVVISADRHRGVTARLLAETALIFVALAVLANVLGPNAQTSPLIAVLYGITWLAQGLMLQRLYVIAHEASHRKLAPFSERANDVLGQLALLPILVPLCVYRKIHVFHHGFNRRDTRTSALDVFVSPWPVTPLVRAVCYALWLLAVFAGGFFLHSLLSIVIFLFIPTDKAQRLSPAFKGWNGRDRLAAWLQFGCGLALHAGVALVFGPRVWLFALGLPLLSFAWVWSLLVYVFHYATTMGERTRFNARSIRRHPLLSWWLMNFNEHATHHMFPNLPWYELPAQRRDPPPAYTTRNTTAPSLWQAILQQLRGPTVVYSRDPRPAEHLFAIGTD